MGALLGGTRIVATLDEALRDGEQRRRVVVLTGEELEPAGTIVGGTGDAGAGLVVAVASASAGLLRDRPFLTGLWLSHPLPAIGKVGTVLLFDVGVFLVVFGTTLVILLTLAEE